MTARADEGAGVHERGRWAKTDGHMILADQFLCPDAR